MQMHYIGKSYVTTVYKFDDGFLWQKLIVVLWDSHLIFDLTQLLGVGVLVASLLYVDYILGINLKKRMVLFTFNGPV